MFPKVTAKLTAIGSDSPLHKTMNSDGKKEQIKTVSGRSIPGKAEKGPKTPPQAPVLYCPYVEP
jgi:hypothetical protein